MNEIKINLIELEKKYLEEGITIQQLAREYNCSETTINNKLKLNNNKQVLEKMKKRNKPNKIERMHDKCIIEKCDKNTVKNSCYCELHYTTIHHLKDIEEYIELNKTNIIETVVRKTNKFIKYQNFTLIEIYNKNSDDIKTKTIVSNEHFERIINHTWNFHTSGYICCRINKKVTLIHRFLNNVENCEQQIDHIDRNKLNNLNENLRIVSASENQINKSKLSNNTSGVTGVTWDKSRNKWKASININGKGYNLGRFDSLESASIARFEAEKKYHNEFIPIERKNN